MTTSKTSALMIASCVLVLASTAMGQYAQRYGIKFGTINYMVTTTLGTMKVEHKQVLTFDDFGWRQREDVYNGDTLVESTIDNGHTVYKIEHQSKEAYDLGALKNLLDYSCDWNAIPDSFKTKGYARELPPSPVAGRVCAAFQASGNVQGGITTYASWNRLCLLRDAQAESNSKTLHAVSVDENTAPPASTFEIPQGYRLVRP